MVVFFDPCQMTARLSLEEQTSTPDGQGGGTLSWTEIAAMWAKIEPVSTSLAERAGAEIGTITHRIWLRFREGVSAGQRLRKGARLFAIKLVQDPDETGRYLTCLSQEIAAKVMALLDDADLALDDAVLVSLLRIGTRSRREQKTRYYLSEIGFRAVTE